MEDKLNHKIQSYIKQFNNICDIIGKDLSKQFPNSEISIYNNVVRGIIQKVPSEPISVFIQKIYANDTYRESILNEDESFFQNNNHEHLTNLKSSNVQLISVLKSHWKEMNDKSKVEIKSALKTLVHICEKYIDAKDDLYQLKKKI